GERGIGVRGRRETPAPNGRVWCLEAGGCGHHRTKAPGARPLTSYLTRKTEVGMQTGLGNPDAPLPMSMQQPPGRGGQHSSSYRIARLADRPADFTWANRAYSKGNGNMRSRLVALCAAQLLGGVLLLAPLAYGYSFRRDPVAIDNQSDADSDFARSIAAIGN